jgi:hypothetical protein
VGAGALALAGCGGGDDDGAAGDRPLTSARFVAQAGAICRDVKRAQKPYTERLEKLPDRPRLERLAPILEATYAESRKGLSRLRALERPPADKPEIDSYLATAEELLDVHAQLARSARAGDRDKAYQVTEPTLQLSRDQRRLARAYGLKDCENLF